VDVRHQPTGPAVARLPARDQDCLRKLAKDTDPKALEQWYNRHVAQLYGQLGADEEERVFIGDGSYLFVPDNENYEGSKRLLFDEHNHPVSRDEEAKMTATPMVTRKIGCWSPPIPIRRPRRAATTTPCGPISKSGIGK